MKCPIPAAARVVLLGTLLSLSGSANNPSIHPQTPLAKPPPEVRMRKLHLVRPDLLQYPIAYEVYC